jgi:hypothetical protein
MAFPPTPDIEKAMVLAGVAGFQKPYIIMISFKIGGSMKRVAFFLVILSVLGFACSIPSTLTPPVVTSPPATSLPPTATEPPQASELPAVTEAPVATGLPAVQPNVTCNELSFYLDPALGSPYDCKTVPASPDGMEVNPQYTQITLNPYVLGDKFFTAHIAVYPVQAFTALLPDNIPSDVAALQALIAGGNPGDSALPFLPIFNAAQVFHARYQSLPFQNGGGIRYMVLFAQYSAPVNNHDLFYTYQGLTSDGQYWVSAILPINHTILPDTGDNPPGGVTWEQFGNDYPSYIADMTNQLNAQPPDSFTPTLAALDALVASISIQP